MPDAPRHARCLLAALLLFPGMFGTSAMAQSVNLGTHVELEKDADNAATNAAVAVGGCTGALIAADVVLTAGHCAQAARQQRPEGTAPHDCEGLSQQAQLQGSAWEDPHRWHPTEIRIPVLIGAESGAPHMIRQASHYAVPRCADLTLLRLDSPVPVEIARPFPVLTQGQRRPRPSEVRGLRHAGWGSEQGARAPHPHRGTGPVRPWGHNACILVALPPRREDGRRLASGDSGAPLLMRNVAGEEIVIAILFARGLPDKETCGTIHPTPPTQHGAYVPTFRGPVPGTPATPIGPWLRNMVPEADHR